MAAPLVLRLGPDASWATLLYEALATRVGNDVDLAEIENTFGFRFAPIRADGQWRDPYSSRVLDDAVRRSFETFLEQLLGVCERLPGLDPSERMFGAVQWARRACGAICEQLVPLLVDRTASWQDLLAQATALLDHVTRASALRAGARAGMQERATRVLQRVCAAMHDEREMDAFSMLEDEGPTLATLLQTPPPPLLEEFQRLGVPHVELLSYLTVPHTGVPVSGAARQMSVARWAHVHGANVNIACVAALPELRRAVGVPGTDSYWHGVAVFPADGELVRTAVATGGVGAAAPCPTMAHTGGVDGLAVVATATTRPTALLAVRVARAVYALVASSALHPRRVRADALLALVSRFQSEATLERERLAGLSLPPADVEEEEQEEQDEQDELEEEGGEAVEAGPLAAHAHAHAPSAQLWEHVWYAEGVDRSLQRDYMVLAVLADELARAAWPPTVVGVRAVVTQLMAMPEDGVAILAMVRGHTQASLQQAVGHVMSKAVKSCALDEWEAERSEDERVAAAGIRYGRVPRDVPGTRGITLETEVARRVLLTRTETFLTLMRGDGDAFATRWFPSRSAKSHARRRRPGGVN